MFLAFFLVLIVSSPYLVWQFFIRPYCRRNGRGYTAGVDWGATMWVDWQEAKELAVARGDGRVLMACRVFLWIHLVFFLIGVGGFFLSAAGG